MCLFGFEQSDFIAQPACIFICTQAGLEFVVILPQPPRCARIIGMYRYKPTLGLVFLGFIVLGYFGFFRIFFYTSRIT